VVLYLQDMLDEKKVYETVRELRWPSGKVICPHCNSEEVVKKGFHNRQKARRRYRCQGKCCGQFDDLTGTVFEGHHQPLEVWILCLYLMGLNLSNQQIGRELGLNKDDVQAMTKHLREGVSAKKKSQS
jgi:transposase-like protein